MPKVSNKTKVRSEPFQEINTRSKSGSIGKETRIFQASLAYKYKQ